MTRVSTAREKTVEHIRSVLSNQMNVPHLHAFSAEARLNQDLYLDSVLTLQLLVYLELELGFEIPEHALEAEHFATVGTLADLLLTLPRHPPAHAQGEA